MRKLGRLSLALGLLFGGVVGMRITPALAAPSTTIELTDVYDAVNAQDEWFQLYNMTTSPLTLANWKVCVSSSCVALPSTTVSPFSLSKIKVTSLSGWPSAGLNGAADMVGLLNDAGAPVDAMNWGTPNTTWANYNTFKSMLWNPGIKAPDSTANQSFFRLAIGADTDAVGDWLTTSSKPAGAPAATNTPAPVATSVPPTVPPTTAPTTGVPPTTAPATSVPPTTAPSATATTAAPAPTMLVPTATRVASGVITGATPGTGSTIPKTGGEFPFAVALAMIGALLALRFARRGVAARSRS